MPDLWVVLPVFNEEASIESVVLEWIAEFRSVETDFVFCILNDGSKDATLSILQRLAEQNPEIRVVDKKNSGHGQTCVEGYRLGVEQRARWIFQIDSDGQCNPRYFKTFWKLKENHPLLFGYRKQRDDGLKRKLISRILSVTVFLATGVWVRDPNVPYRLMKAELLEPVLPLIPSSFDLANVFLSVLLARKAPIAWIDIHFLNRRGGHAGGSMGFFFSKAVPLWKGLRSA